MMFFDPCVAASTEADRLDASGQWSQALNQLQRWRWNNCPENNVPPSDSPTTANWGASDTATGWPPRSYSVPGNPDDRQPPEY